MSNSEFSDSLGIVLSTAFGSLFAAWFNSEIEINPTDITDQVQSVYVMGIVFLIMATILVGMLYTTFKLAGKGATMIAGRGAGGVGRLLLPRLVTKILRIRILSSITLMSFGAFLGAFMGIVFASFQFSQPIKIIAICVLAILISMLKYANAI